MPENEDYQPEFEGFPPPQAQISDEFSKWQLWGEDLIEQLKHDLRSEAFNPDRGEAGMWERPEGVNPMMNEEGITAVVSLARMAGINKFALLSNIEKSEIYKLVLEVVNELTLYLMIEHKKFGVESPAMGSYIITKIHYFLQNALLMAADGGMRDYLKTTVRELRQYREMPEEKKKGGSLFGLFGRGGD